MHTLILGRTESGKTTLAKAIVQQTERMGVTAIVLDPLATHWGEQSKLVRSIDDLIKEAVNSQRKLLVVDESTMSLDKFDSSQQWLTKTSRHAGHSALIIAHSITDIAPGLRSQCTQVFILGCTRPDAQFLANVYDDDNIMKCTKLETFHFGRIYKNRVSFGKVDRETMKILNSEPQMQTETDNSEAPVKVSGKNVRKVVDKKSDKS